MGREDSVEERIVWLKDSIFLLKNIVADNERIISDINFILKKETNYFLDWFNRNKDEVDIVDIYKKVKFISFHLEQKEETQSKTSRARERIEQLQAELRAELAELEDNRPMDKLIVEYNIYGEKITAYRCPICNTEVYEEEKKCVRCKQNFK